MPRPQQIPPICYQLASELRARAEAVHHQTYGVNGHTSMISGTPSSKTSNDNGAPSRA